MNIFNNLEISIVKFWLNLPRWVRISFYVFVILREVAFFALKVMPQNYFG